MATVEQLLRALQDRGVAWGRDLASDLRTTQPTLSRLVAAAGKRVCRMGRTRATRYALTRSVPGLGTQVPVHGVNEKGAVRLLGVLHLLSDGRHWLKRNNGQGQLFSGLPPFVSDMSPQGYIGRSFPAQHPELELPPRIIDWNDNHRLIALARRGEDCVGDLILGTESLNRFLARELQETHQADYPERARTSLAKQPGSSAGGEHPKFTAYREGHHVIVKFVGDDAGAAAARGRDLLVCEKVALEALRAEGLATAETAWFDVAGFRFLEVRRFDRIGERGRRGLLSLEAIDLAYYGHLDTWTKAAQRLLTEPYVTEPRRMHLLVDPEDVRRMRWLDVFGQLIGNTDRHFGNLSFFVQDIEPLALRLAPVYDMLPMLFAPRAGSVVETPFQPQPPTADTLDVWPAAARSALAYWDTLTGLDVLSSGFRQLCAGCRDDVAAVVNRHAGTEGE